jgi:DNA-binding CsgD family transcriptional regulator
MAAAGNLADELSTFRGDVGAALDQITFPAYLLDRDRRVRGMNPAALAIAGDVRGKLVENLVGPSDRAGTQARLTQLLLDGMPTSDVHVGLRRPDGTISSVEVSSVALRRGQAIVGIFGLVRPEQPSAVPDTSFELTPRQHEVLRALRHGCSTEQMADMMGITTETVRNHVRRLFRTLGVHSRLEAVALAQRAHLDD